MQGDYSLMAKFNMSLPDEQIKQFEQIGKSTKEIFGGMTKAGAETAQKQIVASCPNPKLSSHVKISVTYETPSDSGINTKVYFSGYIPFSDSNRSYFQRSGGGGNSYRTNKGIPAEFLAIMYEYGRSGAPFPKHPFIRRAFNSSIEQAMMKAQKELSGGLLE